MIRGLLDWFARRREAKRRLAEQWRAVADVDSSGLTLFQLRCEQGLSEALSGAGLVLTGRRVASVNDDPESRELFVELSIPTTPLQVWIFPDAMVVGGPRIDDRYEDTWSQTPDEAIASCCAGVLLRARTFQSMAV